MLLKTCSPKGMLTMVILPKGLKLDPDTFGIIVVCDGMVVAFIHNAILN